MKQYIKFDEVAEMLKTGWEIYTDRGHGSAPYSPLFFDLWKEDKYGGPIHHATIKKLINDKVITGTDAEHGKYELISKPIKD